MTDNLRNTIIATITRMLSRREHAYSEVLHKLQQRDINDTQCIAILDEFKSSGIQSDARYAQMQVRVAAAKGQGISRVYRVCQQWQVDRLLVDQALRECDLDWFELAKQTRIKRFGHCPPEDNAKRFKQMRFLQYRGFTSEQVNYAMATESKT